jgi:ankyrin repeat protein
MPARPLPDRPSLEQYKKQAKELLRLWNASDSASVARFTKFHPRLSTVADTESQRTTLTLADAQLVIAREHGFESWPKFARHLTGATEPRPADGIFLLAREAIVSGDFTTLDTLLREHGDVLRAGPPRSGWWGDYSQGNARFIIAREQLFENWDQFAAFHEVLRNQNSPVAQFEVGVDAVIAGNIPALQRLLRKHPELIRARSPRTHHGTLLHYVGANGVEGFRQRTPTNAVKVADVLLRAGADINAVSDMYGGADTLGLVATSIHPITAGVQQELMEFLLDRGASVATASGGARLSGRIVNACLANGRPGAAEFLARRGAPLDLAAAAGLGRLDVVTPFFTIDGSLTGDATEQQMRDGFSWACEYGRSEVVDFLLRSGMDVALKLRPHGQTGLHWAAYGGHAGTVRVLLQHHAPVDVKDDRFETLPLGWALYAWSGGREHWASDGYYDIVEQLVHAGAPVNRDWLAQDERASPLAKRIADDAQMRTILTRTG